MTVYSIVQSLPFIITEEQTETVNNGIDMPVSRYSTKFIDIQPAL